MDKRRIVASCAVLAKFAPHALTLGLVAYVGGPSLVVFLGSVMLTAAALHKWVQFRSGVGVLAALAVNLAWLSIYMGAILPRLLQVPVVRSLVAQPLEQVGFRATTYPASSVGLYWLGSLLTLSAPGAVSLIAMVRGRSERKPFGQPVLDRLTWLAALVPFAVVALMNWSRPWLAVAFTMGGDGRNQFLSIEEIRVTASGVPSPLSVTTPLLPNALGALLSSGNGAAGTMQQGDLFSMVSIYVLSASMLIAATMVGFKSAFATRDSARWMTLPLAGTAFVLATSSFVLSTSLHDGFLTLYFGAAVLGVSLVLAAVLPVGGAKVLVLAAGLLSLMGAYTFLAPVLGAVLIVEVYRWVWTVAPSRNRLRALAAWTALLVVGLTVTVHKNWHTFEVTAIIPGAISPIDSGVAWLLLALAISLCCVAARETRVAGLTAAVALVACLFVLYLIERLKVNLGPGNSYYGSKTIVGTVGGVLCLSYIPLAKAFSAMNPTRLRRVMATAGLTAGALVPVAIADNASTLPRPWLEVRNGRATPDDSAIGQVVEHWGDDPYLFFRFADNPPDVVYPDVAADRTLNFWSPISWGRSGHWFSMWLWVYNDMGTLDAAVLCSPLDAGVAKIYTRDPALQSEVDEACGPSNVQYVVLPRLSSP